MKLKNLRWIASHTNWIRILFSLCLVAISSQAFALEQNEKGWFGLNLQQTLSADKKIVGLIFTQLRTINHSHPWQASLIEGALGYHLRDNSSIWFGYRWTAVNPNNGFFQENRLFQQYLVVAEPDPSYQYVLRTRLEEIERTNENQILVRGRERIALEIRKSFITSYINPFFFDEVFLHLTKTDYSSNKFFSQNRLFLGVNMYTGEHRWWEIGYLNQFQMRSPSQTQNQMSHIISITYNCV